MNSDPLVSARITTIQNAAAIRRDKREKANRKLDEPQTTRTLSPKDIAYLEKTNAVADSAIRTFERQQAEAATAKHQQWFDQMVTTRRDFHDPKMTTFQRGQCLTLFCEAYYHVNGKKITPQEALALWSEQQAYEERTALSRRLREAAGVK